MDYRQKILDEAADMFRIYGIRAVTMDMLASRMSISKRTIYEVFRNKDELLKGVLKCMAEKQSAISHKYFGESENVIEAIFKMMDMMFEHFRNMSPAFRLDMRRIKRELGDYPDVMKEIPYFSNNAEILNRGISAGVFREDIDIEITSRLMLEILKMSHDQELFPHENVDFADSVRGFYINFLRGISTPKGLDLINLYDKKTKDQN
ncbi:MAG: TetR/AcrR family transcriptional regulator [Bacteroidales bacterium]